MARGSGEDVIFTVEAEAVEVHLEFGGDRVWLQATVDGAQRFTGVPDGPLQWKGKQIRVRMGHMDGVSLVVNGQRFNEPLRSGPFTLIFKAGK
jgi:hypothetical protein